MICGWCLRDEDGREHEPNELTLANASQCEKCAVTIPSMINDGMCTAEILAGPYYRQLLGPGWVPVVIKGGKP